MRLERFGELIRSRLRSEEAATLPTLEDALRAASGAATLLRQAREERPGALALAALHALGTESNTRRRHWLVTVLTEDNLWLEPLLNEELLEEEAATEVLRSLAASEPQLDVMLLRRLIAAAGGNVARLDERRALRALAAVEKLGIQQRLLPLLAQLLRHPSPQVRSKVALLMGRANFSSTRISSLLEAPDARVRANTLEALWHSTEPAVAAIFRQALDDPAVRVRVNALVGLALMRDETALRELEQLTHAEDPGLRAAAAWGIGRVGRPDMKPLLERLAEDPNPGVRRIASRWLAPQEPE